MHTASFITRHLWRGLVWSLVLIWPAALQAQTTAPGDDYTRARYRVIIDNDCGGDPDGLFALAHHLLSPSVEVRGIIASHHYANGFYRYPGTPEHAVEVANQLLAAMDLSGKVPVYRGGSDRIGEAAAPVESDGARFIVREAMREDTQMPLFIACGAGLTDLASAYLMEPKIASRIRLVWIGGPEHEGLAPPPPGAGRVEYNLGIDLKAGQVIFNQSEIPIWQVPRDAYRQALVSFAELRMRMKEDAKLPGFLLGRLHELLTRANRNLGEAYALGDSPLVLLTALQSGWEADPSSSKFITKPTPKITNEGLYESNPQGRPMRVYTHIDNRLMFEDFYAKVELLGRRGAMKK